MRRRLPGSEHLPPGVYRHRDRYRAVIQRRGAPTRRSPTYATPEEAHSWLKSAGHEPPFPHSRVHPVVVDIVRQRLRCNTCGEEIPMPLGAVDWVVAVSKAFNRQHRRCAGHQGRCMFSTAAEFAALPPHLRQAIANRHATNQPTPTRTEPCSEPRTT